jgi:hypothetical protein
MSTTTTKMVSRPDAQEILHGPLPLTRTLPSGWKPSSGAPPEATPVVDKYEHKPGENLPADVFYLDTDVTQGSWEMLFPEDGSFLNAALNNATRGLSFKGSFSVKGEAKSPTRTRQMADTTASRVGSAVHSNALQELRAQLAIHRSAMNSWDDEDGDRPSYQAFDDAEEFLGVIPDDSPKPSVYASGDAEVGFSWMLREGYIEVAFRGDGKIRYAVRSGPVLIGDVAQYRFDTAPCIPLELKSALERL